MTACFLFANCDTRGRSALFFGPREWSKRSSGRQRKSQLSVRRCTVGETEDLSRNCVSRTCRFRSPTRSPFVAQQSSSKDARARQVFPDASHMGRKRLTGLLGHGPDLSCFEAGRVDLDESEPEPQEGIGDRQSSSRYTQASWSSQPRGTRYDESAGHHASGGPLPRVVPLPGGRQLPDQAVERLSRPLDVARESRPDSPSSSRRCGIFRSSGPAARDGAISQSLDRGFACVSNLALVTLR